MKGKCLPQDGHRTTLNNVGIKQKWNPRAYNQEPINKPPIQITSLTNHTGSARYATFERLRPKSTSSFNVLFATRFTGSFLVFSENFLSKSSRLWLDSSRYPDHRCLALYLQKALWLRSFTDAGTTCYDTNFPSNRTFTGSIPFDADFKLRCRRYFKQKTLSRKWISGLLSNFSKLSPKLVVPLKFHNQVEWNIQRISNIIGYVLINPLQKMFSKVPPCVWNSP